VFTVLQPRACGLAAPDRRAVRSPRYLDRGPDYLALIEEMAVRGSELLRPIFERTSCKKGYLSVQTNPEFHRNAELLTAQALRLAELAPTCK